MELTFVHPYSKTPLQVQSGGDFFSDKNGNREVFPCYDGCCDFSSANPDVKVTREVYDKFYGHGRPETLTLDAVKQPWFDPTVPWRKTMLQSLGSLEGRRILLLGNGESYKEFYFLHLGAEVVFTDLSLVAARRAAALFGASELAEARNKIQFHAVDGMHLPFADQSFDIIYGTKFVGFLDNLGQFFAEVRRCLKPGGKCRFSDDATSPAWESVRRTIVHPVKAKFAKRAPSLARVRSASQFGFGEESIASLLGEGGYSRLVFTREYFFLRVIQLCYGKWFRWNQKGLPYVRPLFFTMKGLDRCLEKTGWMRRNALALTWGFDK